MFLASNCTCAVYFTHTAHVQLLAKNMAATHVHAFASLTYNRTGLLDRPEKAWSQDGGNMRVFAHEVNH